jgi:hypothetical protein
MCPAAGRAMAVVTWDAAYYRESACRNNAVSFGKYLLFYALCVGAMFDFLWCQVFFDHCFVLVGLRSCIVILRRCVPFLPAPRLFAFACGSMVLSDLFLEIFALRAKISKEMKQ